MMLSQLNGDGTGANAPNTVFHSRPMATLAVLAMLAVAGAANDFKVLSL